MPAGSANSCSVSANHVMIVLAVLNVSGAMLSWNFLKFGILVIFVDAMPPVLEISADKNS